MEKVKITQEQAKRIDEIKKEYGIDHFISDHSKGWTFPENVCLNQLTISELARALYVGYEAGPRFKEDDYVVIKETGEVAQIKAHSPAFPYPDYLLSCNGYFTSHHVDELRHATKQEIWWFENGRDVWELKKGDIIRKFVVNGDYYEVTHVDGEYIGLFNIFSLTKETEEIDIVSGGYRVVCFAEDRKDI